MNDTLFTITDGKGHCICTKSGLFFEAAVDENKGDKKLADILNEKFGAYLEKCFRYGCGYDGVQKLQETIREVFPDLILGEIKMAKNGALLPILPDKN